MQQRVYVEAQEPRKMQRPRGHDSARNLDRNRPLTATVPLSAYSNTIQHTGRPPAASRPLRAAPGADAPSPKPQATVRMRLGWPRPRVRAYSRGSPEGARAIRLTWLMIWGVGGGVGVG